MFRSVLTATTAAVTCLALAAPAQAELTVTMDDNTVTQKHFKKVAVRHSEKRVRFTSRVFERRGIPQWVYHQVDTRGDQTPEFYVSVLVKVDVGKRPSVSVYRIDSWLPRKNPWRAGETVDCALTVAEKLDEKRVLRVLTGRGCFRTDGEMPTRLRVNTLGGYNETPDGGTPHTYDPVPARGEYGGWTSAD